MNDGKSGDMQESGELGEADAAAERADGYKWFHDLFQAGDEIARAVGGWRASMTEEELIAFDGNLERFEALSDALVKVAQAALRAIAMTNEPWARRVAQQVIDGAVTPGVLASVTIMLIRQRQAVQALESHDEHGTGRAIELLEEAASFLRGRGDEPGIQANYDLIDDLRCFAQARSEARPQDLRARAEGAS